MSERQLFSFESFHKEELEKRYTSRKGELKLGDKVVPLQNAKYVILGIEECVGPIANKGRGGAQYGFESFLNKFLNPMRHSLETIFVYSVKLFRSLKRIRLRTTQE